MTRVIVPHPDDHRRAGLAGGHGGVDRLLGRLKRNARLLDDRYRLMPFAERMGTLSRPAMTGRRKAL